VTSPAVFSGFARHIWWKTSGVSRLALLTNIFDKVPRSWVVSESISYKIKDRFEISIKFLPLRIMHLFIHARLARTYIDSFGISLFLYYFKLPFTSPSRLTSLVIVIIGNSEETICLPARISSIIGRQSVLSRALNNLRRVTTSANHFPHVSQISSREGSIISLTYSQISPVRPPPLISVTCSKGTLQAASSRTLAIFLARSERYNTIITRMFEESAKRRSASVESP